MVRCVGVTAKARQCRTSGLYQCPKCQAHLCSWHVAWDNGAWCPWCKEKMELRGGWLERVKRGWYRLAKPEGSQPQESESK